ncbi:hypothetical protein [Maricaulis sp. MIT060901]|uniref:hypothetical protein n=1 Tax=Maricaulis sp. MIT060901 TaxID=3096993 RepID=UPI00399C21D1
MDGYALFVDRAPVTAAKDNGAWVELQCGEKFIQLYLTKHAGLALAHELFQVLGSSPDNVTAFKRFG